MHHCKQPPFSAILSRCGVVPKPAQYFTVIVPVWRVTSLELDLRLNVCLAQGGCLKRETAQPIGPPIANKQRRLPSK